MDETRRAVLEAVADGPVGGPEIADDLGVSRTAVWKHVEALREAGFEIESTGAGYDLVSVPEYGGIAVEFGLGAPFEVEYHDAIGSTNDRARELATRGAADVVVLADEQTGGRGRLDRSWASPPGGVWMSLVLRPDLPLDRVSLLTFAAALAVVEAAREAGVDARIKWPNDVVVGDSGDKLAGILTEAEGEAGRASWVVIGIGINADVDETDLPEGATSLAAHVGRVDRRRFVQRVLERFDDLRDAPDAILDRWRERADTLGRRVRVETSGGRVVGEAVDVTDAGALVVEADGDRTVVRAGDCEHLRPA